MHAAGHTSKRQPAPRTLIVAAALVAGGALAAVTAIPASATSVATINGAVTYQRIAGFGSSEAFGQAEDIMNAPAATQQQALNLLYSPVSGAGLTILRNEVGADPGSTIEPTAPSGPGAAPSYVSLQSIDSDMGQLWLAQTIRAEYGVRDVFADAWTAPAYMKTNDSTSNGGTLCGVAGATCASGNWEQAYASFLVQYARDYARAGIPLSYIGFENEANLAPGYDGMVMTPAQTADFAPVIGRALARSGLPTRLECCAAEGWDYATQYATAIEADPAALRYVSLFTSHGYTEWPTFAVPGWTKPVWETEWSTFENWDPAWDDGTDASGFTWAQHIYTGLTSANLSAFLYWWGSSEPTFNGDNESLIQINGTTVAASGRLWALANYSRFVRPGAVRIGATTTDTGLDLTAFRNRNGSVAIVVLNTNTSADTVSFSLQNLRLPGWSSVTPFVTDSASDTAAQPRLSPRSGTFTDTLPARSLVTFVVSR
jgi:glucuronoarabinoxylan endo-1,4-beta-xylanase